MFRPANFFLGLLSFASGSSLVEAIGKIEWKGPCSMHNQTAPMICGTLEVPLDYTDSSSQKTLTLQLAKIAAIEKPRGKSVLLNFGGPGEDSLTSLAGIGAEFQAIFGGHSDLITFNTRGVGSTLPFSCYNSAAERITALMEAPIYSNASDTAPGSAWAAATNYANTCYARMNETGGLVGTAFIARDMMQIVDALDEDGLLHYWGFSYGTALGATVAAMFPDRMGRVILDGVLNPYEYYHGYDNQQLADNDEVFAGFCSACLEAPKLCPLASLASSGPDLKEKLYQMLETIKYHPIPLGATLMDYIEVKGTLFNDLYNPIDWPALSDVLYAVMNRNVTALAAYMRSQGGASTAQDSLQGIKCGDKTVRASSFEQFRPIMERAYQTSRTSGDVNVHVNMECAQWKMSAKEHYMGNFRVKTGNPILLIGNTWDPVTPFESAQNLSDALEGSVLLQHNGYGHSSVAQPSLCTGMVVREYFLHGTLPPKGKVCQPSIPPFSRNDWKNVFPQPQVGGGLEKVLLNAMIGLRQKMSRQKGI
ncbi:hypothetical protein N7510_011793 [Penicillium lagena]|uniref:uncharacterized protein n=1 Tax=Penicillium lagena TaxID=94218 RepID=UPI002541B064|nr:uncharacterized protein N7510_011793 [Penicillium lagena]KAJ5602259.1 hypothetical protein N7510_011793 [Penicillium lagena]